MCWKTLNKKKLNLINDKNTRLILIVCFNIVQNILGKKKILLYVSPLQGQKREITGFFVKEPTVVTYPFRKSALYLCMLETIIFRVV